MRKFMIPGIVILALALVLAGCGKAPAQAALTAADQALEKIKPEAEKYVPEQFNELTKAAADAKAKFDAGNYSEALAAAKDIPAKANDVLTAANAKKDEITKQYAELESAVPGLIKGVSDKVGALAAMKKLPKGIDKGTVEGAKTQLADVTAGWSAASDAFKGGDLSAALTKAGEVKTKLEALAKSLEPSAPAAAAPAK